jgi:hypothetical protein
MYTELHFNAELKRNVPGAVVDVLQYMLNGVPELLGPTPEHALFTTDRWTYMLRSDSYYFSADTHSTLRFDEISRSYYLCVRCNLKNYCNEIEHFVDWITPYLDELPGAFLGFKRYESTDQPTLLFMPGDHT